MFAWFRKVNRKLKAKKCELFHKQVLFLGKVVSQSGISLNPGSVEKIQKWPKPKSSDDIMSFLAEPLYRLTKTGVAFDWSAEHESSYVYLKAALVSTTVLSFPKRSGRPFILDTERSQTAIGTKFFQMQDECVIGYGSYVQTPAQRNYCSKRKELLAVSALSIEQEVLCSY